MHNFGSILFCNHLEEKGMLVSLLSLSYIYFVTINVLWLFLMMPWVRLQFVSVVFPDHNHLFFDNY